jgi:Ras-related protein Rab-5C
MEDYKKDDYSDGEVDNINKEPSPFAPSDLSILGIDTSQSSHINTTILREKIIFVGDAAVGKSSLVQTFLSQDTDVLKNRHYLMTAGANLNVKQVHVPNTNITVDLFLFDIGGQNVFNQREVSSLFWKDCNCIVCVFDVSSRKSFQSCEIWIQAIQSTQRSIVENIPVILVANKIDLRDEKDSTVEVDYEEGVQLAKERQYQYFECSTQRPMSVDSLFMHIALQSASSYQDSQTQVIENEPL